MALEEGYKVGQKPVGVDVIDAVLAKDIDSLEPRLTRHGYNVKALASAPARVESGRQPYPTDSFPS
jgi:hypothetical protein